MKTYTRGELAKLFNVNVTTICYHIKKDHIKTIKVMKEQNDVPESELPKLKKIFEENKKATTRR